MRVRGCTYVSAIVLLAISLFVTGCSKAPTDDQIAGNIQAKINGDSGLQGRQLAVQVTDGSVTLSGVVDTDTQREAAARYASSEPGVKLVVNNLQVAPPPPEVAMTPPPRKESKPSPTLKRRKPAKQPDAEPESALAQTPPAQIASATPPPPEAPAPVETNPAPQPVQTTPAPPPPPPPPQKVTLPSGTVLAVRLIDSVDSEKNQVGDTFHATLNAPLTLNGDVVVPSGGDIQGHLVDVKSAGKFAGQSVVILQLDSITSGGTTYNIQTDQYKKQGSSRGKNTAVKTGAGAGIGAIIGAIAGGGKGAAIGAAAGGGLGAGSQAVTKSQQIKLPSETVLNFTLQTALTVVATNKGTDSGRPKLTPNPNPSPNQ
jgi:hypothetical protein